MRCEKNNLHSFFLKPLPCHNLLLLWLKTSSGCQLFKNWSIPAATRFLSDPCMEKDAAVYLRSFRKSVSTLVTPFFSFQQFNHKTELLSYLILCVSKMPFIPPMSMARSVSGLTGKEKPINSTSSIAKTTVPREDKCNSVKDRLALNLKQLAKKSPPRSQLPIAKGLSGVELYAKRKDRMLASSKINCLPASSSGEPFSKTGQHKHASHCSAKTEPEVKSRTRPQEEARLTLTLTPEAVLLLQRRNSERHQRTAARITGSAPGVSGNAPDVRRRRENVAKRHQPATQRHSTLNGRVATRKQGDLDLWDVSSIVKISLLNEKHKYDDVEYEDEQDYGVDERVVLKCTEWLRGLENMPVAVGKSLLKSTSSVKSF